MKKWILAFVFAICSLAFAAGKDFRIVSLNPALTEILFALDLGKQIIGTTTFSDFPAEAKKIPHVGSYLKPNIEKIISLKPTQVLVFKEGDPTIKDALEKARIPLTVFDDLTIAGFPKLVKTLGHSYGKEDEAERLVHAWDDQIDQLTKLKISKKFMVQVDHNPIFVAGANTFLSEIFEKCGLRNVFSNVDGFKRVSEETVMNHKPDIIIVVGQLHESINFYDVKKFWGSNPSLNSTYVLAAPADTLSRLGPRLPEATLQICKQISALYKNH